MKRPLKIESTIKEIFRYKKIKTLERPLLGTFVPAGFPSPAQNYVEGTLDLNKFLIKHPSATFFVRVEGYSMIEEGIFPDDLLIVDRAIEPTNNKIVIAVLNGELTVKKISISNGYYWLVPANSDFESIKIDANVDFTVWGVVTYVIHKV